MEDFNNSEKSPADFMKLSDLCINICEDKEVKLGDWSQRDIDLFISQFQESEVEPEIDMSMLDPKPFSRSYFENKFPLFDDFVIDVLYRCENQKLQDVRLCPLRVLRDRIGSLTIETEAPVKENDNVVYNASKESNKAKAEEKEQGKENSSEAEATADSNSSDRFRWFKKANEEEEDDP